MAWGWETMSRDIYVSEWSPISRNGKYFSTIDIFSNNICCAKLELPCVSIGWGGRGERGALYGIVKSSVKVLSAILLGVTEKQTKGLDERLFRLFSRKTIIFREMTLKLRFLRPY